MKKTITLLSIILLFFSCSNSKSNNDTNDELSALRAERDVLKKFKDQASKYKTEQIATFLTFQENNAEEAMNFYVGLFENSKIIDVQRYGKDGPAKEGTIMVATFELNGSKFMCSDSYIKHEWTITPGVSNFVECKTDDEIEMLFTKLSENGKALMPLDNYGWSTKFAFIEDQFGVSWQLNLK
ncbi:VOC family protein [Psychroserpens luteolus]|uniref:VOC family protein n=1 Tax=Psychroserpens luteolus TaxID=2855840 RepID=UPI001E59D74C|nr:VOC family protein [Psychroserpens luteolus]MCD2259521.1 VOC family protein [Psychroserpens luteolus]